MTKQMVTSEITVLVADDEHSVREGTKALLSLAHDFRVVGEARNGQEAIEVTAVAQPDVVLMDVRMPVMDGLEATRQIKVRWPHIKIIVLSMHPTEKKRAKAAGSDQFLLKGSAGDFLAEVIRTVASSREVDANLTYSPVQSNV